MTTTIATSELIDLRQQVNYWRSQHQRAIEREKVLRQRIEEQDRIIREQAQQIAQLSQENEENNAQLAVITKMLFGDKQEKHLPAEGDQAQADESSNHDEGLSNKRPRGQQAGTNGHGRKTHGHLPSEEVFHDLADEQKHCPACGKSRKRLNFTEDSEEITIDVLIKRIIHRRYQYEAGCQCQGGSGLLVAPAPLKLFPKTKFSTDFWIYMLMEKYLYQRPSHRSLHHLRLEGLAISQGTITGGFEKIHPLIMPLYAGIVERSRQMSHWHMDETRWLVFANNDDGKKRCWLWVIASQETCVYVIDPKRSRDVILRHLGEDPEGIINSDRYAVYQNPGEAIIFAYCWAHLRRDFIEIHDSRPKLRPWAQQWIDRIANIYKLNDQRLKQTTGSEAFPSADRQLRQGIANMRDSFKEQIKDSCLHPAAQKVLKSMEQRWDGYGTFVDHPQIPMDNNFAERKLRDPAAGRKNYYGSGSLWSAALTMGMFTLFQTLILHKIHPRKFPGMYFNQCAQNDGNPPTDVRPLLPWNLTDQQKFDLAIDSS